MNFTGATFMGALVASQEIEMWKVAMLRQAGYQVIEKRECDFNQDKKMDPPLKSFLQDRKWYPP